MGSYMMHLAISDKVKKKLKLSDKFVYGSILPDIIKEEGQDRDATHYIKEKVVKGKVQRLPDISTAIENIEMLGNKEIALGYIAHLIEDYIWFSIYIPSYAEKNVDKYIYLKDNSLHTEQEFYENIYSDYSNLNKYILKFMDETTEGLKDRLLKIAEPESRKEKINNCLEKFSDNGIEKNVFITKESIDSYIEIATQEVEKVISKLM